MITEAQRQERKNGIFSSDVPRIMAGDGVRVFLEKIGELETEDIGELEYVQLGNLLEPAILTAYERRAGVVLDRNVDTLRHKSFTWLGAHLDAREPGAVVEGKSVGVYNRKEWGEPGTDEVPDRVLWQTQAQLAVTGYDVAHVPALFVTEQALTAFITGGELPIDVYHVTRSEALIKHLIEKCGELWGCIEAKMIPPEPVKLGDARLLYKKDSGIAIEGSHDHKILCAERQLRAAEADLAITRCDAIDAQLQNFMKDAAELRFEGKALVTWKKSKDGQRLDADALKKQHAGIYKQFLRDTTGPRVFLVK